MTLKSFDGMLSFDNARGTCASCGKEVKESIYWLGPIVYPMRFVPEKNEPLCDAKCANDYDNGRVAQPVEALVSKAS